MARSTVGTALLAWGLWAAAVSAQPLPVGSELQVNTYTTGAQILPSIAVESDGDFVVVWLSYGSNDSDTSESSIQGQRFSSDGSAFGAQFQINTYTASSQIIPAVASDSNGRFVVVWNSYGSDESDTSGFSVQGRRYDSNGGALDGQFQVNTFTTNNQWFSVVAVGANGDFVVAWQSVSTVYDTSGTSIQARRYSSSGAPVGGDFQVNSYTTGMQLQPAIATSGNGVFVAVWVSTAGDGSDNGSSIQGQRFSSDGSASGSQFQVNSYTTDVQDEPAVAFDADGDFVVVWRSNGSYGTDSDATSVQGQRFAADGTMSGAQFQVNEDTAGFQAQPAVAAVAGEFVVVWRSEDTSNLYFDIRGRRLASGGGPNGSEFQINTYTPNNQGLPTIDDSGGGFIVAWESDGSSTDSDSFSIQAQRFVTVPQADLSIAVTDGTTAAVPGETLTYTIAAENGGPDFASGVSVTDTFPSVLDCNWTSVALAGASGNTAGSGNLNDTLTMKASSAVIYTVVCTIPLDATGTLSNTATISSGVTDPVPGNNSATDADTVLTPEADLSLELAAAPDPVVAGTDLVYRLTVTNLGPSASSGATVTTVFPADLDLVSAQIGCTGSSGTVTCDIGPLAPEAQESVSFGVAVDPARRGTLSATATVSAAEPDPAADNSTAVATTAVGAEADLSLLLASSSNPVSADAPFSYVVTVSNAGPSDATGVTVTGILPAELALAPSPGACTAASGTVTCDVGDLAHATSAELAILVFVDPAAGGRLDFTADVHGNEADPSLPNAVSESVVVDSRTDLSITKTDGVTEVEPGGSLTYTVTVANHGPAFDPAARVVDVFPESLDCRWTSAAAAGAAGPAQGAGAVLDETLSLPAGGSVTYAVTCDLLPGASGTIANTASVSSVRDRDPSNNSATDVDVVLPEPEADLVVGQTDSADPAAAGSELAYTVTVENRGPRDAEEVAVDGTLPNGVDLVATAGCAEDPAGSPVCSLGTIAAGASRSFRVTVEVGDTVAGTLHYPVRARSATREAAPGDESSVESTVVEGEADLTVGLSGPSEATPGDQVSYTVTVTNQGPSDVSGARVGDRFPTMLVDASSACTPAEGVTCTPGPVTGDLADTVDLAVGARAVYQVTANVVPSAEGTLENEATVEPGEGVNDPQPDNNRAAVSTVLEAGADLALVFTEDRDGVVAGKRISYEVKLTNAGPSASPSFTWMGDFPLLDVKLTCTVDGERFCPELEDKAELSESFTLGPDETRVLTVEGLVPADAFGEVVSVAELVPPEGFHDPDPENNEAEVHSAVVSGQVKPLGGSVEVGAGRGPDLAFDAGGEALIVFEDSAGGAPPRIAGKRVGPDGGALGDLVEISIGPGRSPAVAFDPRFEADDAFTKQGAGTFLTVWQEDDAPSAILGQLSRAARPVGGVKTFSTRATSQVRPDVETRSEGGFFVVWESVQDGGSDQAGSDANESGIFGRFTDPRGEPLGPPEIRLNTALLPDPRRPAVAPDGGGGFLVVWDSVRGGRREIVGRRVAGDGALPGGERRLSLPPGSQTDPAVAFDEQSRRFLVVWRQERGDEDGGIGGRVFDAAVRPRGEELRIGAPGDLRPKVAAESGNFTVVWERPLGAGSVTLGQLVDADGMSLGTEFRVSTSAGGRGLPIGDDEEGQRPDLAFAPRGTSPDGGDADVFFVAWGDEPSRQVLHQRFAVTADLVVAVFDDPDPVLPGDVTLTYEVTVTNVSSADAENVAVAHELDPGLTLISSQGCAEDPAAVAVCTLGTVERRSARRYVLTTEVAPGLRGTVPLPVIVTSSTPDPDPYDNSGTEVTHLGQADLAIALAGAVEPAAGTRVRWTAEVRNAGPSPADDVVVTAPLLPGAVPVTSTGCDNDPGGTPSCLLGTLERGEERRLELVVEIARDPAPGVTQSASVASTVSDPDLRDNTASATVEIAAAELAAAIEAPGSVVAGNVFTATARISNRGTAAAPDVVAAALLPAGVRGVASRGCAEDPAGFAACTLGTVEAGAVREVEWDLRAGVDVTGARSLTVRATSAAETAVATAGVAVTDAGVLPLVGGRFEVRVDWRDGASSGPGRATPYSDHTGFFWFFDPGNVELVVNLFDGGEINRHYWFFSGALTGLEHEIAVTDVETGAVQTYTNPAGSLCGQADTMAFPKLDAANSETEAPLADASSKGSPPPCSPDAEILCLHQGRFRVAVEWRDPQGRTGAGRAVPGTGESGYFWFFNPEALDLAVKVLDGREINGRFWIFAGALSAVEYRITVTDVASGAVRTYLHPPGDTCGLADTAAF